MRAAAAGIDLAFVGKGPVLSRLLVPARGAEVAAVKPEAEEAATADATATAPPVVSESERLLEAATAIDAVVEPAAEVAADAAPEPAVPEAAVPEAAPPAAEGSTALVVASPHAESSAALVALVREQPRGSIEVYRRHWLAWWSQPAQHVLFEHANELSERLTDALPHQRHVVVHRFRPEVASRFLWIKRWRLGVLETVRTLDTAAGAIVHVKLTDDELHDPAFAASPDAATALLLMFDFDENLARLGRLATAPDADEADLARVVDALLVDLANELAAIVAPGWRGGASSAELDRALPRLNALAAAGLAASYDSIAGGALLRLAGRLRFVADCHVRLRDKIPPWRWWRRAPAVRAHVERHVDSLLAAAFGDHNLLTARQEAASITAALDAEYEQARKAGTAWQRRDWVLERMREPLELPAITSDTELLARREERVLTGDEYDELSRAFIADAARRKQLVASGDEAHRILSV